MAEDEIMIYRIHLKETLHIGIFGSEEKWKVGHLQFDRTIIETVSQSWVQNLIDLKIEDSKCMFFCNNKTRMAAVQAGQSFLTNNKDFKKVGNSFS